jgi:hypothetical protein
MQSTKRATVLAIVTAVGTLGVGFVLRPYVLDWLRLRAAYSNLSHEDQYEREFAIRTLFAEGLNPDETLISLLHDSSEVVRHFAGGQLSRRPVSDEIIEAFLLALENDHHADDLLGAGIHVFYRHAEAAEGPLAERDRRIIDALQPLLTDNSVHVRRNAASVLALFLPRAEELRAPLEQFLTKHSIDVEIHVLREMYRGDPTLHERWLAVLVRGAASGDPNVEAATFYYLKELGPKARDAIPQLVELRESSPRLAPGIDEVLKAINPDFAR